MSGKQEKTLPHRTLQAPLRHFRSISLCSGLCIIKGSYYLYRNNRPLMPVPFDTALPLFLQRPDRFYFLFFLSSISAPAISCISYVSTESEYMFFYFRTHPLYSHQKNSSPTIPAQSGNRYLRIPTAFPVQKQYKSDAQTTIYLFLRKRSAPKNFSVTEHLINNRFPDEGMKRFFFRKINP